MPTAVDLGKEIARRWVIAKFRMNLIMYSLLNGKYIYRFDYLEPKEDYLGIHLKLDIVSPQMTNEIIDGEVESMIKEGLVLSSLKVDKGHWSHAFPTMELHLDLKPPEETLEAT